MRTRWGKEARDGAKDAQERGAKPPKADSPDPSPPEGWAGDLPSWLAHCAANGWGEDYLAWASKLRASRQDKPAIASSAKAEPATPAKPAVVHQPSEDSAQSPFAREMDYWRAFYGKGGPGEVLVQAGLFLDPDGKLVPAKSLPEPKTPRARLMQVVRGMAEFAIEAYRPGPVVGQPLRYILDELAEGIAAMRAAPGSLEYQVALAGVYSGMRGDAVYVAKWEKSIREAWRKYEVGTKPADDPKLIHSLLADALKVVGVLKPRDWIKGLPADHREQRSVLGDFRVERCDWDEGTETAKAALYDEYVKWLAAAKLAHPERYGNSEPLKMKAFARELNLSLATIEARPHLKWTEERKETWKGIRILPPGEEPAGDKAIRWNADAAEALRRSLAMPPKRT